MSVMYLGMRFFWLVPIAIIGLLIWLLVSTLKNGSSNKQHRSGAWKLILQAQGCATNLVRNIFNQYFFMAWR